MSGRSGVLHTGHWVVDTRDEADGGTGATLGATASTTVHFARLDRRRDRGLRRARASRCAWPAPSPSTASARPYVAGIEGDPSNVVGLSLPLLRELLDEVGLAVARACARPAPPTAPRAAASA